MQTQLIDATDDAVLASGTSEFTVSDARALVKLFAEVTTSKDVDAFLSGFVEDCVVQYSHFPIMRGKTTFRPFVVEMFSPRIEHFHCEKSLRMLNGNVIGGTWTATWLDGKTKKKKAGRGFEFWIMRNKLIARWDAAFNSWDVA